MSQVQISLKQWIKTGTFGPVHLGMSSDEVQQRLGPPPQFREKRPMIWKYGGVEIY
jgi:hypothetical protein